MKQISIHLVRSIIVRSGQHFGVSYDDIIGPTRTKGLAHARQLAMYLAREQTGHSLSELGRAFRRDYTTVVHAHRKVKRQLQEQAIVGSDELLLTLRQILRVTAKVAVSSECAGAGEAGCASDERRVA